MLFWTNTPKIKQAFLALTILTGVIAIWPFHDYQHWIAQGDHGKDLYSYKLTLAGAQPYRDYYWLTGPAMPIYYSTFLRVFGTTIQSVLLGQNLLLVAAGILIFLVGSVFMPPAFSYVAALWYWTFRGVDFFYTYNHAGGIVAFLFCLLCAFLYLKNSRPRYVWLGIVGIILLTLIRPNIGIVTLVVFFLSLILADTFCQNPRRGQKNLHYLGLVTAIVLFCGGIYFLLLHNLPRYVLEQCFPYGQVSRDDPTTSLVTKLITFNKIMVTLATCTLPRCIFSAAFLLALLRLAYLLLRKRLSPRELLPLLTLSLFTIASLHEYIGGGHKFHLFWFFPSMILLIFFLLHPAINSIRTDSAKTVIVLLLFLIAVIPLLKKINKISMFKNPQHLLNINGNWVYSEQPADWFATVQDTTRFIERNVPPGEKIFALPYEPLYYFLSGRDAATRHTMFFQRSRITPEQEQETIADLEKNHVRYVILSNRSLKNAEGNLGVLGQTHCQRLWEYLNENFTVVATLGSWDTPAGWAVNHAVKILKRKAP